MRRPRAARQRRVRRARRVRDVPGRRSPASSAATRHPRADMDAVHRLHPPAHLPAQPDPRPGQLAHPRSAGGARYLHGHAQDRRRALHLHAVPHPRSAGQRRSTASTPRASSGRAGSRRSTRDPCTSSRCPTSATCTRRWACSACAENSVLPLRLVRQFMGDQVRGFGYLHDGSTDTIVPVPRHRGLHDGSRAPTASPSTPRASSSAGRWRTSCSPSTPTWRPSSASR